MKQKYLSLKVRLQNLRLLQDTVFPQIKGKDRVRFLANITSEIDGLASWAGQVISPELDGQHATALAKDTIAFLRRERMAIANMRSDLKARRVKDLKTEAKRVMAIASEVVDAEFSSRSRRYKPFIQCEALRPPSVRVSANGGMLWLSINWVRSIQQKHIAICRWNATDRVMVIKAKPKSSAFMADMGVKCFDVQGARLGANLYEVNGYAFAFECDGLRHALFAENFQSGVRQAQVAIELAFDVAMAKVQ